MDLHAEISSFVHDRIGEFDQIAPERKRLLQSISEYVADQRRLDQPVRLTFVCTHNSRRSHLSQLWAAVAAAHYGVDGVESYSGGTESTVFNPLAVAALRRAGFQISKGPPANNPRYLVSFSQDADPLECFSKTYASQPNPASEFCAVITCSSADKSCPLVQGAALRVALPFEDPQVADGTLGESEKYDERCAQIAREMLFAFSQAR